MIERATMNEAVEIRDFLLDNYYKEAVYSGKLDYDAEASLAYVSSWIDEICYVARNEEGKLIAVMAAYLTKTYYKQPECQVIVFYIHPDARGTGVSRELVKILVEIGNLNNIGAIYTTSASGMGAKNNNLYTNLFKKEGFQELGTELVRFNNV